MSYRFKGILFTSLSAVIFGFTPILGRLTYPMGSNGITLTFFRGFLCLPVLFILLKAKGISLKLTKKELGAAILLGTAGCGLTTALLYLSYSYQPVGLSTTLHFIYPAATAVGCILLFKEKLGGMKLFALVLSMAGVLMFADFQTAGTATGFVLAILSGFTYAFYIIFMDRSGLKEMHFFKLAFYVCCSMSVCAGLFGLFTGQLNFSLPPEAWLLSLLVSLFTSVGALPLFQLGVRYTGASTAAILSTLEPITSIIVGVFVLNEEFTLLKLAGGALILISVVLIAAAKERKTHAASPIISSAEDVEISRIV